MEWLLNFLIKILGGFLTSFGLVGFYQMIGNPDTSPALMVIFLTIGLALLFAPEIKGRN